MNTELKYKGTWGRVKATYGDRLPLLLASLLLVGLGTVAAVGQRGDAPAGAQTGGEAGGEKAGGLAPEAAYEVTNQSPTAPGNGIFSETFTSKVTSEDGVHFTTALSNIDGGWDGQVYQFKVNSVEGVGRITVRWIGYGEATAGFPVTVEIYNFKAEPPAWELAKSVQTTQVGQNVSLDLDLVDSFESYLDGEGALWVRVRALNQELAAPTNVAALPVASNEVRLSWEDNATSETSYRVVRQEVGGGAPVDVATLPANSTAYTDFSAGYSAPAPGKKYTYSIYAIAGASASIAGTSPQVTMPAKGKRNSATIYVPADAATIQEGLNLAQANDTVQVSAGTYAEAAVVRTPKVTLAGAGVGATTIDVPSSCRAEFCAPVSVVTNSSQVATVRDLGTSDGSGTLRSGVRYGGGVYVYNSAADLRRLKLFRASMADSGGMGSAIALVKPDVVTVDNVAAMLNLADGPVVYLEDADKGVVFKHVTLSGNGSSGAEPAAGIWAEGSSGSIDVVNSVLWSNSSGQDEVASDSSSDVVRVAHSVIGPRPGPVGGPITTEGAQGPNLVSTVNADPLLTSYQDPHLQAGSPAIDMADAGSATSYDYENVARPSGVGYDAGASEYVDPKSGGKKAEADVVAPRLTLVRPAPRPHASLNTDAIYLVVESVTPPAAPSNLRIAGFTADRISIRFLDNATDEDGFTVHRLLGGLDQPLSPIAANPGTGDVLYPDYGADLPSGRLAPGTTYCYYVTAYRGAATANSPSICQTTEGDTGTAPDAPSNVAAVGISAGQIRLTWSDNSATEDGFAIYRKRQGVDDYFSLVSPPAVANATSYVDSGGDTAEGILQSGETYCYRVAAYNEHGLSTAVPTDPDGECAATPLQTWVEVFEDGGEGAKAPSLADLGVRSEFQFLDENDSVELETSLAELLGGADAFNWQVFAIHLDTPPQGLTSLDLRWRGRGEDQPNHPVRFSLYDFAANSWVHQPVFPGGEEEGDVRPAEGIQQNSVFTFSLTSQQLATRFAGTAAGEPNTVLLWVRARAYIPTPAAPENLRAYPSPAPTTVYLAWDDRSGDETGFEVQRATPVAGPVPVEPSWATVGTVGANVTTYSQSVSAASDYLYRVRAVRGAIGSSYTAQLQVSTPLFPPYLPNVVPNGSDSIQVNWQMHPGNGTKFALSTYRTQVYRAPGTNPFPQDWQLVGTATGGATTYRDGGLQQDTTYSYYLRFEVPDAGTTRYSTDSDHVYTKTTALGVPAAPQDLAAATVSTGQINLTWKDVDGELAYDLERQTGLTGTWQTVDANIPPDETSYGDVGLVPGQLYRYRIRAKNAAGFSTYSNEAQATTFPASGDEWQVISQIPSRSGLVQGATVLAPHSGYLYAASNDAANQGKPTWFHLNVWRSTDSGQTWQWQGETDSNIDGNVPVAMVSFGGKLFLLTGSRLWSGTGATWAQVFGQGVGDAQTNGYFSHLTVFNGKLFVLLQDGSVFYTADGGSWAQAAGAPAGIRSLAQYGGQLVAGIPLIPQGGGAASLNVYRSATGEIWSPLGTLVGEDGFGRCDSYGGMLGMGSYLFVGAADSAGQPCLWRTADGQSWARTGGAVNIWSASPDATGAHVATTAQYPEPVAAHIDGPSGAVELVGTQGLDPDFRLWSVVMHNGSRYAAAFPSGGVSPAVPDPAVVMRLIES